MNTRKAVLIGAVVLGALASVPVGAQTVVNTTVNRVLLGFTIECYTCEKVTSDSTSVMEYKAPPVLIAVAKDGPAERAGLRNGDVLTHVNGLSITTRAGAEALVNAQAGKALNLTVRRAGQAVSAQLTPVTIRTNSDAWVDVDWNFGKLRWGQADSLSRYRGWQLRDSSDSSAMKPRVSSIWSIDQRTLGYEWSRFRADSSAMQYQDAAGRGWIGRFNATLAGLELSVEGGSKQVKVTVVEPNCVLAIEVEGTRILVRAPSGCR